MEESINFSDIASLFHIPQKEIGSYSPLTFAYIGDAVFDLVIRSMMVAKGNTPMGQMDSACSMIVCAASQAKILQAILPDLDETEADMVRRGRNAKPKHHAKNASLQDYREATALETLLGFLYMEGQVTRLNELIRLGLERTLPES